MAEETPKPKKPIYKRWWVWVLGLIVLFIIIGVSNGGSKDAQNNNSQTKSSEQQPEQVISVTATKLAADYDANEVAADEQYKNKLVQVSGTIKDIGKDILDTPYVALYTGNLITSVQCMFDKADSSKLVNLAKNQKITLTGRVSGKLGNVLVKDCGF